MHNLLHKGYSKIFKYLSGYNTFKNLNLPVMVVTHKIQVASLNLNIFNINGPSPPLHFGPFYNLGREWRMR